MSLKRSVTMRNNLLDTNSFKGLFDGGLLVIFSGTGPTSPSSAIGASDLALLEITINGSAYAASTTGLTFATSATSGYITKATSDTWQGTGITSGTAGYFRFFANASSSAVNVDSKIAASGAVASYSTVTASTICFQGTCGTSGDLQMVSTTIEASATSTIDQFKLTLPE